MGDPRAGMKLPGREDPAIVEDVVRKAMKGHKRSYVNMLLHFIKVTGYYVENLSDSGNSRTGWLAGRLAGWSFTMATATTSSQSCSC